mmetsp:Transcript_25780/g.62104  ORF Transcript_25780/g.62104 Transcript_25780/m.62104 type:complete len:173 (+) Transcript_25780:1037-1555(+)
MDFCTPIGSQFEATDLNFELDPRFPLEMKRSADNDLHVDFSTDISVQSDLLLGALPVLPEAPAYDAKSFWSRMEKIHVYTPSERKVLIEKYRKKSRKRRLHKPSDKVRYACRQAFANSRPRIGGRFVNKEELTAILADPILSKQMKEGKSMSLKAVRNAMRRQTPRTEKIRE